MLSISLDLARNFMDIDAIVGYILERQNEDGGYTFCRGTDSSAEDTFYAIESLRILWVKPRNIGKTIRFLKGLQYSDGGFDSVKIAYYVVKSLGVLGYSPSRSMHRLIDEVKGIISSLGSLPDVYVEISSELEYLYLAVELAGMLEIGVDRDYLVESVLRFKNSDGSFGSVKHSRIASTSYALDTLKILGYRVDSLADTLGWVRRRESPDGGFGYEPGAKPICLEDTYFGLKALEALGEKPRYQFETLRFIAKLQNLNGGFRRSIFLGISDLESTYRAVRSAAAILSYL
ncbi:MAG: prenyltransferase/squalene oxidase repeat-containing protein [Candidatus Bathyarchaeia archaeon]